MKLCVLVKEVPVAAAARRIDPVSGLIERNSDKSLNRYDRFALEAAVILREEAGGGTIEEIVAVTMGPQSAERSLRRALALGADRAVHLCDPALAGSDAIATGYALAQVLKREAPDLVLTGARSAEGEVGAMAGIVAEYLDFALLTGVESLEWQDPKVSSPAAAEGADKQTRVPGLTAVRTIEAGIQTLAVTTPAVLAVTDTINVPRYVSLAQTMGVDELPLERLTAAQAEIDLARAGAEGAAVICRLWTERPARAAGTIVAGLDPDAAAARLVAWLGNRGLL